MTQIISVLVVDDEALIRSALHVFIGAEQDMRVVGEADNGRSAVEMAATSMPDVVLLDIQLPVLDGVAAATEILAAVPTTRILALTGFTSTRSVGPILRAGASGYLLKDSRPEEIVSAIRRVHSGGTVLSPGVHGAVVDALRERPERRTSRRPRPEETLTDRELDVVRLLGHGLTNREIASSLCVSESTIKTHLGHIMDKWKARDRMAVLLHATTLGLVQVR